MQSSFAKVGLGVNKAFGNFGGGLLSGIVAGFSADKLKDLLDASTQITNALKVAGLSGARAPETDIQVGYVTNFLNGAVALQTNAAFQTNYQGQPGATSVALLSRAKIKF